MYPEITRDEVFMIGTNRLWLRWPQLGDAGLLAELSGDPRVATMIASWPVGASEAYARERVGDMRVSNAKGTSLALVMTKRSNWQVPIGLVGIKLEQDDRGTYGHLGYHLSPDHWERGYASEAVKGLIEMTRLLTRIPRLRASVVPDNTASAEVLRKNGFAFAGSGKFETRFRGTVEVDHFERDLRAIGYDVDGFPIPSRSHQSQSKFETGHCVT